MHCTWPVEEYADYSYNLNNPDNIITIDPSLVTGDIDFIISDQSTLGFDDDIFDLIAADGTEVIDSDGNTIIGHWRI
jgi:hypothetical protein